MSRRDVRAYHDDLRRAASAGAVLEARGDEAFAALAMWIAGPGGNGDGTPGRSSDVSDPTATSALARRNEPDFELMRRTLLGKVHAARLLFEDASRIALAATVRSNRPGPAGCTSCSRIEHPRAWQAVHRDGLCSWCADHRERAGALPSREQSLWHLDHPGRPLPRHLGITGSRQRVSAR